jgi:hypothetical protein
VVIWPEHLGTKAFLEGVDMAQLAADYRAITGGDLPAAPAAVPVDHKGLLDEVAGRIREVAASAEQDVTELLAWLASHNL